ncbi:MAG: SUMF1/EgtB/PvdO family nonheme iron enzyme [Candidatus Ozemobacteraceae bacterium]
MVTKRCDQYSLKGAFFQILQHSFLDSPRHSRGFSLGIIKVWDIGCTKIGQPYFIMEYLAGGSLRQRLLGEPLGVETAFHVVMQILEGLEVAHQKGVIHRDIKPENILFRAPGDFSGAVLTDFGLAKASDLSSGMSSASMRKTMGSAKYTSPEQCEGKDPDNRSDLYSLGIVLFQMLYGIVPFEGEDYVIRLCHIDGKITLPARGKTGVTPEIEKILRKALARFTSNRFNSAQDFLDALPTYKVKKMLNQIREFEKKGTFLQMTGPLREILKVEPKNSEALSLMKKVWESYLEKGDYAACRGVLPREPLGKVDIVTEPPFAQTYLSAGSPKHSPLVPAREERSKLGGVTPLMGWAMVPGNYKVSFTKEGFSDQEAEFTVRDAESTKVNVRLVPLPGSLFVSSEPSAEVFIDGKKAASSTPATIENLTSGMHQVEIRMTGFAVFSQRIETKPGETFRLENIVLKSHPIVEAAPFMQPEIIQAPMSVKECLSCGFENESKNILCKLCGTSLLVNLENNVLKPNPVVKTNLVVEAASSVQPNQTEIELGAGVKLKLVLIPAGSFLMGSKKGNDDEEPVHKVEITKPFYLGIFQVTQDQYESILGKGTNPSIFKGTNKPVEQVSWYDAVEFCNALSVQQNLQPYYVIDKSRKDPNNQSGADNLKWLVTCDSAKSGFRLPTESEWEYSCRAGTKTEYYWGDEMNDKYCWYDKNSVNMTHYVGTRRPNQFDLFDMSGNVLEWCWDWKGSYTTDASTDPRGPEAGSDRVFRGGLWGSGASLCRSACRSWGYPAGRRYGLGFRLLRTP